jgi:GT2 family glycosyltransferase
MNEHHPTVYVLTAVHNRKSSTLAFCDCLKKQTYTNFVLVLVDDGSTDGTAEAVREYPFRKEICHGDGNLWWAGGVRKGLARLQALKPAAEDIVLITNDDTTFGAEFLEKAVEEMRAQAGQTMLCVSVGFTDSHGWTDGGSVCYWPRLTFKHYGSHPERIDCASTRCLFMSCGDLIRAGTFRPRFLPHYFSDYEFTIRARRHGIKILPARSVICQSTENTTGFHRIPPGSFLKVSRYMLSPRFSANPLTLFSFVLLAAPLQWKVVGWFWAARTVAAFLFRAIILNRLSARAA